MTSIESRSSTNRTVNDYLRDLLAKIKKQPKAEILEPLVLSPDHPYYDYQQIINGIAALLEQSIERGSFAVSNTSTVNFSDWNNEKRTSDSGWREDEYLIRCRAIVENNSYTVVINRKRLFGRWPILSGESYIQFAIEITKIDDAYPYTNSAFKLKVKKSQVTDKMVHYIDDPLDDGGDESLSDERLELLSRLVHPILVLVKNNFQGVSSTSDPEAREGEIQYYMLE